ncbi:MAG: polysaccharide biosynthesis/export family protein [Sandaracinaceae bacterium]
MIAGLLLSAAACGPSALRARPPDVPESDSSIGPGDVFEVRVYGENDLSSDYRVSEEGTIDFPYLGRVDVGGLEPGAIADRLEEQLRENGILVNPQVSVLVTRTNRIVTVTGAVRSPGNFEIVPGLTVVQAINLAGGFTDLANRDGTVVRRRVDGELRLYSVQVDAITRGQEEDVPMRSGDIIFVPERPF